MELKIGENTYSSFSEYLDSKEYSDLLDLIDQSKIEYAAKAKDFFNDLDYDNKLLVFYHVMNTFYENEFQDKGSYRHLLYTKFGFACDSYALGMDCGCLELHNSIYSYQDVVDGIKSIFKMLNVEPTSEILNKATSCFLNYGSLPRKTNFQQLNFDFDN